MIFDSKSFYFPIEFSLYFHVCSKMFLGTVFRGSRCRSLANNWILVSSSIFRISKKSPFILTRSRCGPPETLPERLRGAGSILHRFVVTFGCSFHAISCHFRYLLRLFRCFAAGPTPETQNKKHIAATAVR